MADSVMKGHGNYIKYCLMYYEVGVKTLVQVLKWLSAESTPIQNRLVDLTKKWPQKFNSVDRNALEDLKGGKIIIEQLNLSFLVKISLLLLEIPAPAPEKDTILGQVCHLENQNEIESFLFKLIDGQRSLRTLSKDAENISDSDVFSKCEKMKECLAFILQKAGRRVNIPDEEIYDTITSVQSDIDRIYHQSEACSFSYQNFSKYVILNEMERCNADDPLGSLHEELQGFSVPSLTLQDDTKNTIPLQNIFVYNNSQVIVVLGELGMGKTSLTKFLFNSWKSGLTDTIKDLSNFDVAFRVECKNIKNKDANNFFQEELPISFHLLSSTSSMMKFMEDFKILWIMDGYDECTAEFKSFMTVITKNIPESHRILITTRPNKHESLKASLKVFSQLTLAIDFLDENNTDEMCKHYIADENIWKTFKKQLESLGSAEKSILQVPLNLSLYIELWLHDESLAKEPFTTKSLYRKSTNMFLHKLIDKESSLASPYMTDDLSTKVRRWFYGSLCKHSFLSAMQWDNTLNAKTLDVLKEDALQAGLVASNCLSTFLVETKGRDGKIYYDFKHSDQQYILATFFLRNLKIFSNSPMNGILNNAQIYPALQMLKFFIEMAIDDDTINTNTAEICYPLIELSSSFKSREQKYLWCITSITAKFNKHFMAEVPRNMTDQTLLDTSIFENFLEIAEFLKYVHPKKIKIVNSNTFKPKERDEFLLLLEVLKEQQQEIHLHTNFQEIEDAMGTSEINTVNATSLKITSFTGKMDELPLLGNHHSSLETLELLIYSEEEFLQLCEILTDCESLNDIQLYIMFDSFSSSVPEFQFPEELLEQTTLSFRRLTEDNFDNFIVFLTAVKGDECLKFKSIFHCMDQISESHKQLLDEIASIVVFERCPYSKSLSKDGEFQLYTFPIEFHEVHSWKYCYQTYRNR